jgi:anti-sigma B factor antagonist
MPHNFAIEVATNPDEVEVCLSGEIDLAVRNSVVDEVGTALRGANAPRLVIDLHNVTFCDSSGLGALLDIRRLADDAGIEMVLRKVPPAVARLLDLSDVDGWLARE